MVGWPIDISNENDVIDKMIAAAKAKAGETFPLSPLSLDHLIKLWRNLGFREAFGTGGRKRIHSRGFVLLRIRSLQGATAKVWRIVFSPIYLSAISLSVRRYRL